MRVLTNEKISSIISLLVAIIILGANFFQWWDITYNGKMITRGWVKLVFIIAIVMLFVAFWFIMKS